MNRFRPERWTKSPFTRDELSFMWDALAEYEHIAGVYQDPTAEPINKRAQHLMQKIEEMLDDPT